MKLELVLISTLIASAYSESCGGVPGFANGQCVGYGPGGNCAGNGVKNFKPTCGGNCFVHDFNSIATSGDGVFGTNCKAFSDTKCKNLIGETGNNKFGVNCKGFKGGKSMQCFYRC